MRHPLTPARIGLLCALMLLPLAPGAFADQYNKRTDITITEPIEVPGAVLQPGTYTFKLLDEPADRHIVQITSKDGKTTYAVAFTAAARRLQPTPKPMLTFYETKNGGPNAVDKWFWPGEMDGQQFLYPHKQAQQIAQNTGDKVPEAPVQAPERGQSPPIVSQHETQDPTLPAAVNKQKQNRPAPQEPEQVAQATPPPQPSPADQPAQPSEQPNTQQPQQNQSLPRTASSMPLLALLGLLSLGAGAAVRTFARDRS